MPGPNQHNRKTRKRENQRGGEGATEREGEGEGQEASAGCQGAMMAPRGLDDQRSRGERIRAKKRERPVRPPDDQISLPTLLQNLLSTEDGGGWVASKAL